ncbi:hypothetical protein BDQ17DRAFT_1386196 [Cyathus striatus]|nr:hypothetical protein BDQ17DRAFT_1386196 [Cyathus striatus]
MSKEPHIQPVFLNPATAPTVDTSPNSLGLTHEDTKDSGNAPSDSRIKRLSNVVVDRLSRSVSGKSTSPGLPALPRSRMFSLTRRTRARPSQSDNEDGTYFHFRILRIFILLHSPDRTPTSPPSGTPVDSAMIKSNISKSTILPADDSPFIVPPSPPLRPSLSPFRGDGSMRAGTQTLIQALQALPWAEIDNDDEATGHELGPIDSDSDDQAEVKAGHMSSSIHAIHRPVARSRKLSDPLSEGEASHEDFEEDTPRPSDARPSHIQHKSFLTTQVQGAQVNSFKFMNTRTGSMATVRLHRRARLAEKLRDVFELDGITEVWAEMPCWLLRSVLLQGYMYLTNSYLEDQVLKSGSLNKKAQRTKRWIKHWFVLKNDALSWYQSSSDPYFPHGIVDLRYAISCEPAGEKEFRVRTHQKSVTLGADSVPSRDEWVKAIRKVIFKAQNMGDSVKIAIPYPAILDVERSSAMDFSETIEVKVVDKEEHFSKIRDALNTHRTMDEKETSQIVLDTTPISTFRLSSLLRPFSDTISLGRTGSAPSAPQDSPLDADDYTHISRQTNTFIPLTTSPRPIDEKGEPSGILRSSNQQQSTSEHTYPPSTSTSLTLPNHSSLSRENSNSWSVGVPSWLKSRRVFGGSASNDLVSTCEVKEMYSSTSFNLSPAPTSRSSGFGDMAFSVLESPDTSVDMETAEKFRATFAYDEKEALLGHFPGYIYRLLPVYGRLYISTNFFCFKSLLTFIQMTLPIPSRFGHHGLIIIVKGHEELFFEFGDADKREAFVRLLEQQMEDVRKRLATGDAGMTSPGRREALILEEFEASTSIGNPESAPAPESMSDSLPAVMFTSASSTFLTFKPSNSLHFTFLTIGSRGDVQPYIALAKGLMADGHKCRIATHGEFQEWIESHGIEFGYVGGDPAELMRICVENGTFTFRGWVDDLLKTSWEACQGTDILVESPSAMGGYHIAEALAIPYFRAFTMTWTRTRAYPHAFAVPERKMGGSYNYMSYVMFDQVFWRAIAGQINRWRRNVLNLESTSLDKMEPHKIPFLYNFSPHVVPPPLDWPEWIRITGYWFLDDAEVSAKKWTPPEDLVKFIDDAHAKGKKVVYIGFGSIVVSDPKAMTQCVIQAVIQSGVYAILSKGWSDRLHVKAGDASEPEEPLPDQIYAISSVPHDWLFRRIDAACHHGGAGTTGASLRAGIPTIIRPFFGDQFFWADRVEALGVGSGVRKLTISSLTEALTAATTDIKQVERAKLIGEQIRALAPSFSENGVATAIESIYRDLEYARSLIKRNKTEDVGSSTDDEAYTEHATIRNSNQPLQASSPVGSYSSAGSGRGAPSEDWSVISDQEDRRSSDKRTSFTAAVLSVLPDSLVLGSPRRHPYQPKLDDNININIYHYEK